MSKPTAYTENNSVKECWKNSMFKGFFNDRKKLFDEKSYPAVGKGLKLSDPTIKFGGGSYTFKTSEKVDKATWKDGNREFQARYKKDSKKFDISVKENVTEGVVGLVKYENRGDAAAPNYVVGVDFSNKCGFQGNAKYNPFTQNFKASGIYDAGKFLPGALLGGDLKTELPLSGAPKFNLGVVYKSQFGTTGAAFNDDGLLTVNHVLQVDKNLSTGIEFVQSTKDAKAANPLSLGVAYKIDGEHDVKARLNKGGEMSVALTKKFSSDCGLTLGTVVDVSKPDALFKAPCFGFKLDAKM